VLYCAVIDEENAGEEKPMLGSRHFGKVVDIYECAWAPAFAEIV
jgi:hypothetical protein